MWGETTGAQFADAPYVAEADPVLRVCGYHAFRRALALGEPAAISGLLGAVARDMIAMLERYVASLLALPAPPILAPRPQCAPARSVPSNPIIVKGEPS